MKRILIVMILVLVGCPRPDGGPPPIHSGLPPLDPPVSLVSSLTQTAGNKNLPAKERQRAVQQLRKLEITKWGRPRPPSGRFYLLDAKIPTEQ